MSSHDPPRPPVNPDVLVSVADRFGTPCFVYSEHVIRERVRQLREAFAAWDVRLLYAMKANSNVSVLRVMQSMGVGLDVVAPGEAALAFHCGYPPEQMFFSGNNLSDEDVRWACDADLWINVGEVSTIEIVARHRPGAAISLRVNLEVGAGHHQHVVTGGKGSKFGITEDAIPVAVATAERHGLRVCGLHQHIGSGNLDPTPMVSAVERLTAVARTVDGLEFVNIGGGLGVPYRPDEEPLDPFQLANGLQPSLDELKDRGVAAWLEPGRFLVAESGALLVRVTSVKEREGITFAGTDSGMGHLIRPALYDAYHNIWNLSNPDGELRQYDVVGNICETGDYFAKGRMLQEVREGDLLAVCDTGAYAMSMSSEYNLRPRPAEVMVDSAGEAHISRKRESTEDIAARHFQASNLAP